MKLIYIILLVALLSCECVQSEEPVVVDGDQWTPVDKCWVY